jgi:N-acetylmuramoyl-L-alanine amidase
MFRRWLICTFVAAIIHSLVVADSLVIAGQSLPLSAPLLMEKHECLAPLASGLPLLGAKCVVGGKTVTLITANATRITLTLGSATALVGNKPIILQAAPRRQHGVLYLPVNTLAPLLGVAAQYTSADHTLSLSPFLQVTCALRKQQPVVQVRSPSPLHYVQQSLATPPRVFFDFTNAAYTVKAQMIPVGVGKLARVRVAHAPVPGKIRVTLDLTGPASSGAQLSEHGHLLTILVGIPPASVAPSPVKPTTSANVALTAASLQAYSSVQSVLTFSTNVSPPKVSVSYQRGTRRLILRFAQARNSLQAQKFSRMHDGAIAKVEVNGKPNMPGTTCIITLQRDAPYQVQAEARAVLVTVGASNLRGLVVVLDPGHGGVRDDDQGIKGDPGATGPNGTHEKDVALDVGLRAAHVLRNLGATVYLTRATDVFIELPDRAALANAKDADLFVAIHCNSSADPDVTGIETLYHTPDSRPLADALQAALVQGEGLDDREVKEDTRGLCVLRSCHMPSALVEIGFLSNTHEESLLASAAFRQLAAEALVNGIRKYAAQEH